MKWLQDNPLGMALAASSGALALLALGMAIVWNLPVAIETSETGTQQSPGSDAVLVAHQVAALSNFQVINEKPIFNESRLPVIIAVDAAADLLADTAVAIKDAPDVRLTGVIITPTLKIASLTPANEQLETVMAYQGQSLTGEYVGWQLSIVKPRSVVLESRDGKKMELNLQVHDVKIKAPPKSVVMKKPVQTEPGQGEQVGGQDEQPLSRAEQIRQRIAERREELRREQEEQQAQGGDRSGGVSQAKKTQNYQSAIRAMMRNKSKDTSSNDKKDG